MTEHNYNLVESASQLEEYLHRMLNENVVACDTETTGLYIEKGAKICGVSMSGANLHYYSPVRHTTGKNIPETFKLIDEFLGQFDKPVVYHNAKFDLKMFKAEGIDFPLNVHDTILMAHFILQDNFRSNLGLKKLCSTVLGEEPEDQTMLLKHLKQFVTDDNKSPMGHMAEGNPLIVGQYAQSDTRFTRSLYFALRDKVKVLCDDLYGLEIKLMKYLVYTEMRGVLVDRKLLEKLRDETKVILDELIIQIRAESGLPKFNPMSPLQLENLLFEILNLEKPTDSVTKTGRVSLGAETLDRFDHPLVKKIQKYKKSQKLYSTYYLGMGEFLDKDDVVHCQFNQIGARTGRFSEEKPNLQNIPRGDAVRQVFSVRPGYTSYRFDYSQIEYRLFAHYCRDKTIINGYKDDPKFDIHQLIADELGISRVDGKTINFAVIYGAGVKKIALQLGISVSQARTFLSKYYSRFPGIASLQDSVKRAIKDRTKFQGGKVVELGWIQDLFGRRHYVEVERSYMAVNRLIQGCAANLLKTAMVNVYDYIENQAKKSWGDDVANLLNCIHDELEVEVLNSCPHHNKIALKIKTIMEDFQQFKVPIYVDSKSTTTNWAEAKDWDGSAPTAS